MRREKRKKNDKDGKPLKIERMIHLAINSTTAVVAESRVNPALPATAVVEIMAKWLNLYLRTV